MQGNSANEYDLERLISCPDLHLLVAEIEHEVIGAGYAQVSDSKPSLKKTQHFYLEFMYVSPGHRSQGIHYKRIGREWLRVKAEVCLTFILMYIPRIVQRIQPMKRSVLNWHNWK
ncbi:GNAT family N-acetyltransferase [Photobacterium sp. 1_MG-2023]|uniref:GNAT family N-acetyltransferase n=1 Tax=Photobacterium sp. 1_MG-2023 TaxID=3062646 RepID=UPI0034C691F7